MPRQGQFVREHNDGLLTIGVFWASQCVANHVRLLCNFLEYLIKIKVSEKVHVGDVNAKHLPSEEGQSATLNEKLTVSLPQNSMQRLMPETPKRP